MFCRMLDLLLHTLSAINGAINNILKPEPVQNGRLAMPTGYVFHSISNILVLMRMLQLYNLKERK